MTRTKDRLTRSAHRLVTMLGMTCVLLFLSPANVSASETNDAPGHFKPEKQSEEVAKRTLCENEVSTVTNRQRSIVERLKPGEELQGALKRIASEHHIKAGVIATAVGSLSVACLRMAGASETKVFEGPLEIVSVIGTLSDTSMHIHLSACDSTGKSIGGHLMNGSKVYTTIELVILDLSDEWTFERKKDEKTGYLELDPHPTQSMKSDANPQ